ncbi:MAG: hypothetical protein ACPG49_12695 [Chitinophagales bacterium]
MKKVLLFLLFLGTIAALVYFIFFFKKEVNEFSPLTTTYTSFKTDGIADITAEEAIVVKASQTANVGLAASGGGSRALTATLGYYRGLTHLGLMNNVRYISSVSGGAWASISYTYLPKTIKDRDFLGQAVGNPKSLYWGKANDSKPANIAHLSANNLGNTPGRLGLKKLAETAALEKAKYHYPLNQAWIRAIGKLVLHPYGLADVYEDKNDLPTYGKPTKYYSLNEKSAQKLIDLNPSLTLSDFQLVERKRPLLIVNTSIFETTAPGATLLPVESTPLAMGIRGTFLGKGIGGRDIGGGFVPPFAFGTKNQEVLEEGKAKVMNYERFSLSDIAGLSSATFAEGFETSNRKFDTFIPKFYYWPIANVEEDRNQATVNWFADGGNLENTGINALLARKVPTIVSFVNCAEKIKKMDNGLIFLDYQISSLFGYMPLGDSTHYTLYKDVKKVPVANIGFQNNQVFPSEDFKIVQEGLWEAKQAGGPVMFLQKLTTVENPYFDVEGGQEVTIVWSYLNKADKWFDGLSPKLRKKIADNPKDFSTFPTYATEKQLHLNAAQVNLMSQMTTWSIIQDEYVLPSAGKTSKALFEELLGQ